MTSPLTSLIRTNESRLTNISKQLRRAIRSEVKSCGGIHVLCAGLAMWNPYATAGGMSVRVRKVISNGSIREMLDLLKLIDKKIYGGEGE